MLRRRILASAMASVMAIGSVAVVASAEETAVETNGTKSAADLEELVKSFDEFRKDEIHTYGSKAGERFLDAIEYADNVLSGVKTPISSDKVDADDYTVAYDMIQAVYKEMLTHRYTAEDLAKLIAQCEADHNTRNILNEVLGDNIWTTKSFQAFEAAFEYAQSVVASTDTRVITDTYEDLYEAHESLVKLDQVTKSEFRTALKEYEAALQLEYKFEPWRRGSTVSGMTAFGEYYVAARSDKEAINKQYKILDEIKTASTTSDPDIVGAYKTCVADAKMLNGFTGDEATKTARKADVTSLLREYNGRLVYDFVTSTGGEHGISAEQLLTSIVDVVGADGITVKQGDKYKTEYVAVNTTTPSANWFTINSGKLAVAEMTVKAAKKFYIGLDENGYALGASTSNGVAKQLTETINVGGSDQVFSLYKLKTAHTYADANWNKSAVADEGTVIAVLPDGVSYVYDVLKANAANGWFGHVWDVPTDSVVKVDNLDVEPIMDGTSGVVGAVTYKTVNIGTTVDLTDFIKITPDDVVAANDSVINRTFSPMEYENSEGRTVYTYVDLERAFAIAKAYVAAKTNADYVASGIQYIDMNDTLIDGSLKGSTPEWTLVHRYLKYALEDKYGSSSACKHTRQNIRDLVEDCYTLAEDTGEASIFAVSHNKLVEARQDALDWLKAADKEKTYKDNETKIEVDGKRINGEFISDEVYHKLKGYYDTLAAELAAFRYSYGEIYDYIAKVEGLITDGTVTPTEDVLKAIENVSYALSTVKDLSGVDSNAEQITLADNSAFTGDRLFQPYNRVNTGKVTLELSDGTVLSVDPDNNKSHKSLASAYEALQKVVAKQSEVKKVTGDLNDDGVADMFDAAIILKADIENTIDTLDKEVADFDQNGSVDIFDAAAILKAYVNS